MGLLFSYCLLHIRLRDGGIQLIGGGVRRLGLFALLLPAGLFALRAALRLDALCQQQEQHQQGCAAGAEGQTGSFAGTKATSTSVPVVVKVV